MSTIKLTKAMRELQRMRPQDSDFTMRELKGHPFIGTAGHGYLVVLKGSEYESVVKATTRDYSYESDTAYFLEEDCEAGAFLEAIAKA